MESFVLEKFLIRHLEVYYKVDRLLSDDSIQENSENHYE